MLTGVLAKKSFLCKESKVARRPAARRSPRARARAHTALHKRTHAHARASSLPERPLVRLGHPRKPLRASTAPGAHVVPVTAQESLFHTLISTLTRA